MPVTHEEIAALAFQLWKERGEPIGSPEVDWERAEATLQLKAMNLVKTALSSDVADGGFDSTQASAPPSESSPSLRPPATPPQPQRSRTRKAKSA